ncbi:MAG: 13E12 repeat family protein, partial [Actinobacteria bacterium]|nr:13E12 repeat family protein [Actinomycetota bacterium]
RGQIALARRLPGLPHVAAELAAQRLSVSGAQRLAAALGKLRRHVDRPDGRIDGQDGHQVVTAVVVDGIRQLVCEAHGGLADDSTLLASVSAQLAGIAGRPVSELARLEAAMVLLAQHVEPGLLPSGLARLVDAVLPNELERRAADAHSNRRFSMRRHDDGSGWVIVEGELDLECGELLHTVLQAELTADPDNPTDTQAYAELREQGWTSEQELPVCDGPRSLRQRRHDALRNGLRRYLDAGISGLRDKTAPHLAVTVGIDTLHQAPGALPAVGGSGATLPVSLVSRWSCDSTLTRFVFSLGRKVLETSHSERTLKAHERRAAHLQTGGCCQGAGCTRGPGCRLIPHHGNPWARCHTTSLADTVLLCEQTHHQLHTGHTIRLKDGRWLGPDGWVPGPSG